MLGECHWFEWALKSPVITEFGVSVKWVRRSVMASSSDWVLVDEFRGGMELLEIVSVWFVDILILIAWVFMRFVDVVGGRGASVKVMLSFTYVSRPPPDLDVLSFLMAE